jgi:uncharacterized protein (TIGR02145 family)
MEKLSRTMLGFFMLCLMKLSAQELETIQIGYQTWMQKNLDEERFRNGDVIPEVTNWEEWMRAGENEKPAWCYFDNDSILGQKHGKLYNWYAVMDPRGLSPVGFHVPNKDEWEILFKTFEDATLTDGIDFWLDDVQNDHKGFRAIPSGGRFNEADVEFFYYLNIEAWWWTTSDMDKNVAYCVNYDVKYDVLIFDYYKDVGISVRCIKDVVP